MCICEMNILTKFRQSDEISQDFWEINYFTLYAQSTAILSGSRMQFSRLELLYIHFNT